MREVGQIAEVARALSDETRVRILALLMEGGSSVSELVERLGISQPRVSTHLAVLSEVGLVSAEAMGRQRVYRVREDRVEPVLSAFSALTPAFRRLRYADPKAAREVRRNSPIRRTRTCYDHLAGLEGVRLLDGLLERGWLEAEEDGKGRPLYSLTPEGEKALPEKGVDVEAAAKARRIFAYGCLDWTEGRPHLGGALGAAILDSLQREGFVRREEGSRVVAVKEPVGNWLDRP